MTIKTLPALTLVAALLTLASCSKDDEDTPEIFRRRVAPSELPVPSCDDTTDDGKFEVWNNAEDHLMLVAKTVLKPSGTHVPGFISDIRMPDRRIDVNTTVLQWNASIDTSAVFHMSFALVDRDGGRIQALADETLAQGGGSRGRRNFVSNFYGGTLTPGCKRLYYCGFQTNIGNKPVSSGQMPVDTMTVLYRGHFDVEIY